MRVSINVWMGEGDKRELLPGVLWINETPLNCRHGKQRKKKNRQYKRQQQELIVERNLLAREY